MTIGEVGLPTGHRTHVLIVDDEPDTIESLRASLQLSGFTVSAAAEGAAALAALEGHAPDIAVIDAVLPGHDGFVVAQQLRTALPGLLVLFLSARCAVEDRIAGLRAGADDYVPKPFDPEEVVLRMSAILRRARIEPDDDSEVLRYADLELDEGLHEARRHGQPIALSPTEFSLLRYLMVNARKVVSKSQILDRVWGGGSVDSRLVESYISYLRRKIDSCGPPLIHTVWGVGYSLRQASPQRA